MLTCMFIAGTIFLTNAPDGKFHNIHHLSRFSLNKDHSTLYSNEGRFSVPQEWRQMEVPGILNTCAEQAEIKARGTSLTPQNG
jgi:hypothetical protein